MWVKREKYEEFIQLQGQVESKKEQIARLEREVVYWRERFEEAQRRTDRIHDRTLVSNGIGPVSDLGLKEVVEQGSLYQKMMKDAENQATEMFADEIPGQGGEGSFEIDSELLSAVVTGMKSE